MQFRHRKIVKQAVRHLKRNNCNYCLFFACTSTNEVQVFIFLIIYLLNKVGIVIIPFKSLKKEGENDKI